MFYELQSDILHALNKIIVWENMKTSTKANLLCFNCLLPKPG